MPARQSRRPGASALFETALERIDAANADDPTRVVFQGREYPKELLYARRMTDWLARLAPDAPEHLRLAARGQHIRRWQIPRDSYPGDRGGYLRWRSSLYAFHAEHAGRILAELGYDETTVARVQALLQKKDLASDPEMQILEDVACLVFLESYFSDFAARHDAAKLQTIIRRTWRKMSPRARATALTLDLPEADRALVRQAVGDQEGIDDRDVAEAP